MAKPARPPAVAKPSALGELEAEVLQILWDQRESTAESVRASLRRSLKESTVRTVLRRLEEKGYATHRVEGRTFIYSAAEPAEQLAVRSARGLADWLFRGSVSDLLVGLVDGSRLSREELDRIKASLEKASKESAQ